MFENGKESTFSLYNQHPNSQASSSNLLNVLIRSQDAEKNLRTIWGPIAHYATVNTLRKKLLGLPQAYVGKGSSNNVRVSPLDQFTYSICQNVVDNVCLYYGRRDQINRVFDERLEQEKKNGTIIQDISQDKPKEHKKSDSDDDDVQMNTNQFEQDDEAWCENQQESQKSKKMIIKEEDQDLEQQEKSGVKLSLKSHYKARQRELDNIPLRVIPLTEKLEQQSSYKCAQKIFIENQKGISSGKSGWCIICRNSCNQYCKQTRYPVCDNECGKKWKQMCQSADDFLDGKEQPMVNEQESVQYLMDAVRIFKSITKLSLRDIPKGEMSAVSMRTKTLGLELILTVVQNPVRTFLARNEFLDIIKEMLREGLMRHAVSSQTTIFERSVSIFFQIFMRFRCSLKQEVGVFLQQIFIRILQSGNSSFLHKQTILQNFENIIVQSGYIFEIFVNYDCDVESPDIFNRIVQCLSKISQGKFARSEHQSLMTPQEEFILRTLSLKILVMTVKNINKSIIDQAKREQQMEKQMEEDEEEDKSSISNEDSKIQRRDSNLSKISSQKELSIDQQQLMKQIDASESDQTKRAELKRKIIKTIARDTSDIYEETRQYKIELAKVITKFNSKPSHGVAMLLRFKQANEKPLKQVLQLYKNYLYSLKSRKKAQQIASFLKTMPGLSKQQIGLYISQDQQLNKQVLYAFVDLYNFQRISFIDSLRILLSGFRLQGEGQKVDRVMEKFGEKFYKDNPSVFTSAQSAYILAYATIMLQTSIHNPSAKANKMTLKGFKDLVKSVENGKLQLSFLQGIYDSVERQPITSSEDEENALRQESNVASSFKRKQELYQKEGQNFAKKGVEIIKTATASGPNVGTQSSMSLTSNINISSSNNMQESSPTSRQHQKLYQIVRDSAPARPMFLSSWGAMLAVFSVLLQQSEHKQIVTHCLEGFVYSIKICGHFSLLTEKDAFVSSLVKFTQLYSMRDLKQKNIQCTKMLLHIATHDGDLLKKSWYHVLQCISRIDFMHVIGTGGRRDHQFFKKDSGGKSTKRKITDIELQNCQNIVYHIPQEKIDLVFQQSVKLDEQSIIDFIESLCKISKDQLSSPQFPRFFSLQKIVEVSDFNMSRIRMVWTKIWKSVSQHFQMVGTHTNLEIAKLAVDSLRQLAYRFLDKQELSSYTFQKDFLKPFQVILLHNLHTRSDVKDLIIACAVQMAAMMAKNIKSGWSVLFNIYRLAANDNDENNIKMTLKCFEDLLQNHFKTSIAPNFFEAVACITNLARNRRKRDVAIKAIYMLRKFAQRMEELTDVNMNQNHQIFIQKSEQEKQKVKQSDQNKQDDIQAAKQSSKVSDSQQKQQGKQSLKSIVYTSLWSCLLSSIASFIRDPREQFQKLAPNMLFQVLSQDILSNDDEATNPKFWKQVFSKVIIPQLEYLVSRVYQLNSTSSFATQGKLIECLQQQQKHILHNQKCAKNGQHDKMIKHISYVIPFSKSSISTLFTQMTKFFKLALSKFAFLSSFIEPAVLSTFRALIVSNIQDISNISTLSMKDFITVAGSQFSQSMWEKVILFISQLAKTMLPVQLLEDSELSSNLISGYEQKRFNDLPQGSNGDQPMFSSTIPPEILQNVGPQCKLPKIDFKIHQFRIKATALHTLLQAINMINELYFSKIKTTDIMLLLDQLNKSYIFAGQFNSQFVHRYLIWSTGFIQKVQFLPALIKQEKESIIYYVIMLNKLYNSSKLSHSEVQMFRNKLFDMLCNLIRQYIYVFKRVNALMAHYNTKKQKVRAFQIKKHQVMPLSEQYPMIQMRELDRKIDIMNYILNEAVLPILSQAKSSDLKQNSKVISNLLIELTMADDMKVRERVKELLIYMVNLIQS